jgi:predicted nucleic acid-binding protein
VIVLDSSAAVDYLIARGPGDWVEARLNEVDEVHAPFLLDVEVVGALRKRLQAGELARRRAEDALADFQDLRVRRYPHLPFLARMWELRDNLTTSDAAFVALAEALGMPLVTTDLALAGAPGPRIPILSP